MLAVRYLSRNPRSALWCAPSTRGYFDIKELSRDEGKSGYKYIAGLFIYEFCFFY